jgi:hypothetical protein
LTTFNHGQTNQEVKAMTKLLAGFLFGWCAFHIATHGYAVEFFIAMLAMCYLIDKEGKKP